MTARASLPVEFLAWRSGRQGWSKVHFAKHAATARDLRPLCGAQRPDGSLLIYGLECTRGGDALSLEDFCRACLEAYIRTEKTL